MTLNLPGQTIQLDEVPIDLVRGVGERLGTALCEAGSLMNGSASPAELAKALNALLETMG